MRDSWNIISPMINNKICRTAASIVISASSIFLNPGIKADEYMDQRISLFELLPIKADDIVFLGDSLTDGGEFSELFGMECIKNRGIRSDDIPGVEKRLDPILSGNPKKIFLLIGINDISHGTSVNKLAQQYEKLVKKIAAQSPGTKLYLQSVLPVNNFFKRYKSLQGKETAITELNERIKSIARSYGATWVDLRPALADESGNLKIEYTNDGLHLNGQGYQAWCKTIENLVKE